MNMARNKNQNKTKNQNQNNAVFETKQTIYLLRHGVAYHNIPIHQNMDLRDPKYTDSKLVLPHGHAQARAAGRRLKSDLQSTTMLDCVFVSPLSRCLETAYFVMEEVLESAQKDEGHCAVTASSTSANASANANANANANISTRIPWIICKEELREAYGIHYSDKRSSKSYLKQIWPHVHFHPQMTEEDEAWKPDRRETLDALGSRIDNFLRWLSWHHLVQLHDILNISNNNANKTNNANNAKQHLLVVSHGVWIEYLFHKYKPEILQPNGKKDSDERRRVHNCDLFCVELVCQWYHHDDCDDDDDDDDDDEDAYNNSNSTTTGKSSNQKGRSRAVSKDWTCQSISLENVSFLE